jgi:hypothetical protein
MHSEEESLGEASRNFKKNVGRIFVGVRSLGFLHLFTDTDSAQSFINSPTFTGEMKAQPILEDDPILEDSSLQFHD